MFRARSAALYRVAAPLCLFALAVGVRLPNVWRQSLSQDEVFSARVVTEPTISAAVDRIARTESTPPLWYGIAWFMHRLGVPVVELRLLSVAFGGLLAVVVYWLARDVVPARFAVAAGALTALGFEVAWHGAELRAYEQLALMSALLALALLRCVAQPGRVRQVALATVVCCGMLTHYFFVYSLIAASAWLWLERDARAGRRRATVAIFVGVIASSAWLPEFLRQFHQARYWWIGPFSLRVVVITPLRLFAPLGVRHLALALAVVALTAYGVLALARASPRGSLFAALAVGPIILAATVWAAGFRIYAIRNLLEAAPFLAIAAAKTLSSAGLRRGAMAATALVATVAAASLPQTVALAPPYRSIAQALVSEGWRPAQPIAVFGNFFSYRAPLEWYLPNAPLFYVGHTGSPGCETVFVVTRARRYLHAAISLSGGGGYLVSRLDDPNLRHRPFAGVRLLATRQVARSCVKPSSSPHVQPLS